jgi:hypothetical protein
LAVAENAAVSFDADAVSIAAAAFERIATRAPARPAVDRLPVPNAGVSDAVFELDAAVAKVWDALGADVERFAVALEVLVDDAHNADRWTG